MTKCPLCGSKRPEDKRFCSECHSKSGTNPKLVRVVVKRGNLVVFFRENLRLILTRVPRSS